MALRVNAPYDHRLIANEPVVKPIREPRQEDAPRVPVEDCIRFGVHLECRYRNVYGVAKCRPEA